MRKKPSICSDVDVVPMATGSQNHYPKEVVEENRCIDRMRKFLSSPLTRKKAPIRVFGSPLEMLVQRNPTDYMLPVPFIVSRLCKYIEAHGLATEGVFRISGNTRTMEKLRASFEATGDAPLETEGDVAAAGALLKSFLRELPEPVVPPALQRELVSSGGDPTELRALMSSLPPANYHLLKYLARFLGRVAQHQPLTRMGAPALGIVFGPNLFRVAEDMQGLRDQSATNQVVTQLITNYAAIFEEPADDCCEPLSIDIPPLEDSGLELDSPLVTLRPDDSGVQASGEGFLAGELSPQPPQPKRRELDPEPPTLDPLWLTRSEEDSTVDCPSITDDSQSSLELSGGEPLSPPPDTAQDDGPTESHHPADHRFSWPILNGLQQEDATLSPFPPHMRKTSSMEGAPLSPSAFRSYLSHRGPHLDPNLPPSPPVEQDPHFVKSLKEEETTNSIIRQIHKRIHSLKKKVRSFEEAFEMDHGYRPSYADKLTYPEVRKHLSEIARLRKELKELKEGSGVVSPVAVLACSGPSVEQTYRETVHHLAEKRRLAHRPENVDAMDKDQVVDEKVALQKALLRLEQIHGRPPSGAEERDLIRPLYERYRNVKRILGRLGGEPAGQSELQPILEHVAMDFSTSATAATPPPPSATVVPAAPSSPPQPPVAAIAELNLHELSLQELATHQQQARSEKHRLRRLLRDFEFHFQIQTGKKLQKEDRVPMEEIYSDYKHVKAHLKLLEALLAKRKESLGDNKSKTGPSLG